MTPAELSQFMDDLAARLASTQPPGYFDCLEALDALEFHILDRADQRGTCDELSDRARRLHRRLAASAQATIDDLVQKIRTHQFCAPELKQRFGQYARASADQPGGAGPYYDRFDDFLSQLFQIDDVPEETRPLADEMVALQPTPGRIILEMIEALPFTAADWFYDLGSGLGQVPMLVALLTGTRAVGVEYEPSYVHYARRAARKLGLANVAFRNLDAQEADLGDGTIFFMYTPFVGKMLRTVLDRLAALARERGITVCTYGPCTSLVAQEPWLQPLRYARGETDRLAIFNSRALPQG